MAGAHELALCVLSLSASHVRLFHSGFAVLRIDSKRSIPEPETNSYPSLPEGLHDLHVELRRDGSPAAAEGTFDFELQSHGSTLRGQERVAEEASYF